MPTGRGLTQIGRINSYPTSAVFISTYPPSPADCGDIITFNIKINNIKDPAIIPTGTAYVIDLLSGTVLGSATLDPATGTAAIISTNSSGVLNVVVRYSGNVVRGIDGYSILRQFGASTSAPLPYNITLLETSTQVTGPADGSFYCPGQDTPISSFTHLSGSLLIYPTNGYVQFLLWTDASNYIPLPLASVDGYGVANSYIPANTTFGVLDPADGYYLQAIFMGSETGCFAGSNSPGGLGGTRIVPLESDHTSVALSISAPPGGICFRNTATAHVTITGTDLIPPTFGLVDVFEFSTGTIIGSAEVTDGYATVILDGYSFPTIGAFPHTYTLRARYYNGDPCYDDGYSALEPPKQLTVNKYTATLDTPTTGAPDLCASSAFNFNCQINADTYGLDGYFRFDLYRADIPFSFVTSFGVQSISSAGSFLAAGSILPHTMSPLHTYYVVGVYTPSGLNCYDTDTIISAHSVTLTPANC